ncbi:MAG: 23S rRNA (pseudouridine(1915)-N(3))-methyltransferase RlmH [Burkholderiales bacterium]|nr:23S rRNA (pseudouridine(1915)-N(3))-methyltransferase RlmH [Burkholderiales bacterium]
MRLVLAVVGHRPPAWAETAFEDLAKRFPPEMRLELRSVKAEPRMTGRTPAQLMAGEAQRLEAVCPKGSRRVVLDERGSRLTTQQLAERLKFWLGDGRDVTLIVGGPDGLDPALKATADETMRLSDLTLPHAFVRVLLAEALYRAWTVCTGHPYHRE